MNIDNLLQKIMRQLLFLFAMVLIYSIQCFAQSGSIVNNGARIVSKTGSYWVVNKGNFTLTSESAVNLTTLDNLIINSDASLTLTSKTCLTVNGTTTNHKGITGLVLKSGSDGTGSLIHNTAGIAASGERYMSGNIWHMISPTATGQNIADFLEDADNSIASKPATQNYGLAPYQESDNTWNYFKTTGVTGTFDRVAKGYEILRTADGNVRFLGTLAATDQSIPVSKTSDGWNLTGNPYPCALDINKFLSNANNISAIDASYLGIYVSDVTNDGYVVVNKADNPTLKLAQGEGFFIKSATASGTLNFTTDMKSHTSDPYKTATLNPQIQLIAQTDNARSATTVKFIHGMTAGLDPGYDAGLFTGGESLLTLSTRLVKDNGIDFMLQCLPDKDFQNMVVPVGLTSPKGTTVKFTLGSNTLATNSGIYLEDRAAGKTTRLDEPGSFYNILLNKESNGPGRFYLHFNDIISPVDQPPKKDLTVFPLPPMQLIRILGSVDLPAKAFVYDMNSKIIAAKTLTEANENDIPLPWISTGVYLVQIRSAEGNREYKVVWTRE
jgi:hypothetical protein